MSTSVQSSTNQPKVGGADAVRMTRRCCLGLVATGLINTHLSADEVDGSNQANRTRTLSTSKVAPGRVKTKWATEYRVGRFQVHSDAPMVASKSSPAGEFVQAAAAGQAATSSQLDHKKVAAELIAVQRDVERTLKIQPAESTIHVVLFHAEHEYNRYLSAYFPKLPRRRALYLQDRGPGMLFAYWHADLLEDLRHEVVHAVVNDEGQSPPIWLDEGVAEYFEVPAGQRFAGSPHLPAVVAKCNDATSPSLAGLAKVKSMAEFTEGYYRDSWAWVHFLLHRNRPLRRQLVRYLADLRSGTPVEPLEKQLQRTCPDLHQQFVAHFRHFASRQG